MRARLVHLLAVLPMATAGLQDPPPERLVRDLAAAVEHLRRLGCAVVRDGEAGALLRHSGGAVVSVRVGEVPADAADHPLVLVVDDVGAARRRLHAAGLVPDELVASPSGARSLRVLDPDGHPTILRARADADAWRKVLPGPGELDPLVLEVAGRYPTDGTHRYHWPKSGSWKGCTKDLAYGGEVVAVGDPERRCYCCGLTFEVFLDAWMLWCRRNGRPPRIRDLDAEGVRRLQVQWFGSAQDRSCLHTAIVGNGLGSRITELKDARAGDFVQLWRADGSGHSVVFHGWERDGETIVGMRYWSTQGATDGIGTRTEYFDDRGGARHLLREPLWICRVGVPADPARRR